MKTRSLFVVSALIAMFVSASAFAQSFITNGLVAYYPFNGNANDASGNGDNGTVNGATLTSDRFGVANAAYSFNGINNYISFASPPTTQIDNWTITAWVQLGTLNQMGIPVYLGYDDGVTANGYAFSIYNHVPFNDQPGNQLNATFGGIATIFTGFAFSSTNQWYQVVMARSSGVTTFYVNGAQTPDTTTITPATPTAFRIGSENGSAYFNGAIDDVRIYNRALSSNEVVQLYAYEAPQLTIPTNGLVAYYPFNGNANDASGHGDNGTVNGATLTSDRFGIASAAYSFNGVNSYISFPSAPTTQVDNWTMSAWVKPASLNQMGTAVSLGYDDGVNANGYSTIITGDASSTGNKLFAVFGGIPYAWVDSGFIFASTTQWYQLVMLRDSGVTKFYVNGVLTSNNTATTPITPTSFRIGSENGLRFFNGAIDDVRIYNRALSSNEVGILYSVESAGPSFCTPHAAEATAIITNGFVIGATITDSGCGYTNAPLVLIQGSGGSNAVATATIQNGYVTAINIINPGSGYTNAPDILIGSPPFVPTVTIGVYSVYVTQHVVLGLNYVLESSSDMVTWTPTGPPFTAQSEEITSVFPVSQTGQFFRIIQVP